MSEPNVSPTPQIAGPMKEIKRMTFPEAIGQVILGKKIYKIEWRDTEFYGFLNAGFLSFHRPGGKIHQWIVSEGDLLGDDYIVL